MDRYLIIDTKFSNTLQLKEVIQQEYPDAVIVTAKTIEEVQLIVRFETDFQGVFISAKLYNFNAFAPLFRFKEKPILIFTIEDSERRVDGLFQQFRFALLAPYTKDKIQFIFKRIASARQGDIVDGHFLLLKIDWKYIRIKFSEITRITRVKTLTFIELSDGKTYTCYYPVSRLMKLLPADNFIQIKRGLIVPCQLNEEGPPQPIFSFEPTRAAKEKSIY